MSQARREGSCRGAWCFQVELDWRWNWNSGRQRQEQKKRVRREWGPGKSLPGSTEQTAVVATPCTTDTHHYHHHHYHYPPSIYHQISQPTKKQASMNSQSGTTRPEGVAIVWMWNKLSWTHMRMAWHGMASEKEVSRRGSPSPMTFY
jgi:hypothetical protein